MVPLPPPLKPISVIMLRRAVYNAANDRKRHWRGDVGEGFFEFRHGLITSKFCRAQEGQEITVTPRRRRRAISASRTNADFLDRLS